MKILYIITQSDGGGAQKYTLTLAQHFKGQIAAGQEAKKLFFDAKNKGLAVFPLKHLKRNIHPWHDFWAIWETRNLIKRLKPEIVHLNSSKAGIIGSFASIGLKTKVVFTAHGFVFNEPLPFWLKTFYLAMEKTASHFRHTIIAVSDEDKNSALEHKLIDPKKIATIHNGLPNLEFYTREKSRWDLNFPENDFIFCSVANFYKTKGLSVLLGAISMLEDAYKTKCRFVIIGDGAERQNLELTIKKLGLEKQVLLHGKIENASRYLRAFDAFVLPSLKEGLPYTILEALQAGLPIIASNVGGIPEAIDDAGLLVEPNDAKTLASAIKTILDDKKLRQEFSQKALKRSTMFTEEKMLSATTKVYKKLLTPESVKPIK